MGEIGNKTICTIRLIDFLLNFKLFFKNPLRYIINRKRPHEVVKHYASMLFNHTKFCFKKSYSFHSKKD